MKNRHGLTSFIKDKEKISELYEAALQDDSIDAMDHFFIAVTSELGESLERELIETKRKYNELLTAIGGVFDVLDDMPGDIDEMLDEKDLKPINEAQIVEL